MSYRTFAQSQVYILSVGFSLMDEIFLKLSFWAGNILLSVDTMGSQQRLRCLNCRNLSEHIQNQYRCCRTEQRFATGAVGTRRPRKVKVVMEVRDTLLLPISFKIPKERTRSKAKTLFRCRYAVMAVHQWPLCRNQTAPYRCDINFSSTSSFM